MQNAYKHKNNTKRSSKQTQHKTKTRRSSPHLCDFWRRSLRFLSLAGLTAEEPDVTSAVVAPSASRFDVWCIQRCFFSSCWWLSEEPTEPLSCQRGPVSSSDLAHPQSCWSSLGFFFFFPFVVFGSMLYKKKQWRLDSSRSRRLHSYNLTIHLWSNEAKHNN